MNRKILLIIIVALQIAVLGSFVVRYEILKATGTTIYIPLRGYDPTDIFRGDYVTLSYELPYTKPTGQVDNWGGGTNYIIPEVTGSSITRISAITTMKPSSGLFFQAQNAGPNQIEDYVIESASGTVYKHRSNYCRSDIKAGDSVTFSSWSIDNSSKTISMIEKSQSDQKTDDGYINTGTISSKSECTGSYRFQVTAADRWFIPEGTGEDLEKKIRENNMYAEWKVGKNGAVIVTNILSESELPK